MQEETCAKIIKEIRESEMFNFIAEFDKLSRKARKLGLPEPSYRVIERHIPRERVTKILTHKHEDSRYYVNILEISDVDVHVGGWKVVGIIDNKTTVGHPLYTTFEKLPKSCYEKPVMLCEHCGYNRFRNTVYILRNGDEYKQVGSTCVEDFVMVKNVNQIVQYLNKFYKGVIQWESEETHEETFIMTDYLLPLAIEIYNVYGFHSINSSDPTAPKLLDAMNEEVEPSKEAYELYHKIYEYYEPKLNTYPDDLHNNIATTACSGSVIPNNKSFTYLLLAVREYEKAMQRAELRKEHYGTVGEKYEFDDAEFLGAWEMSTCYGDALKLSFKWNGYRLSSLINMNTRNADYFVKLEKHSAISFIAKVKKHDIYKEEYYTNITGIKLL